ncbi:MAG: TolC family protein [Pseudomonadota bacterium]
MKQLLTFVVALSLVSVLPAAAQSNSQTLESLSLTLQQAETRLLQRNRDIQSAQRAVQAAQAGGLSASARPNPQISINSVSISPQYGIGAGSPGDKRIDTTFRVDELIERGDKRGLRMRAAQQLAQASQADLGDATRQARVALAGTYYNLLFAQRKMRLMVDTARLAEAAQAKASLRLKAGDLAASEVARIEVDTLHTENDAQQAYADIATAQLALAYLIGADDAAARLRAVSDWPALTDTDTGLALETLIARRPDMRAAQARLDAARTQRDLARAQRTRDISVGAQLEHYPSGTDNTVGVGVSFPLFLGNDYAGDIRSAEVAVDAAQDAVARTHAQALGELNAIRNALQVSTARLQRYQTGLIPAARRAADAAEFAFSHGAISAVDVLDARRVWRSIQLEALSAQTDYAKALASWHINIQPEQE